MSEMSLGRFYSINKAGIVPQSFPEEPFYYYNLPDFDLATDVRVALGRSIDSNKFLVQSGSVLISKLNPRIRRVWLVDNDGKLRSICSTEFVNLVPTNNVDAKYLLYFLQQDWLFARLDAEAVGTTNSHVRFKPDLICRIEGDLPPIAVQRRIARILTTLDNVITQTEALIAKYQAIKLGLMHDLLTYGMHEGRRQKTGVAPEGTPNRSLPAGWRIVSVAEIVSQARQGIMTGPFGAQLGTDDFIEEGVPVLRIGNVQAGYLNLDDLQFVSAEKANTLSRYRVMEGDLLFARSGATTGRNSLASQKVTGWLINYHIIRVAVDRQLCDPRFLFACFNAELLQRQVNQEKGKGTREGINTQAIAGFRFPLPTIAEQHAISDRLESVDLRISREQQYASKLRQSKSGLMQDLLTGKVPVKADEPEEITP